MAALATTFYQDIMNRRSVSDRGKGLLLYLWLIVPGALDVPDHLNDTLRRQVYNQFLALCTPTNIPAHFNDIQANHGWPWDPQSTLDTENGKTWAKAFAYAAIRIGLGVKNNYQGDVKSNKEISEEAAKQVRSIVYGQWPEAMDKISKEALALREAEVSDEAAAMEAAPQVWVPPTKKVYLENLRPDPAA